MNLTPEQWEAIYRDVENAPPLSPKSRDIIASAFRGRVSPWRDRKLGEPK